MVWRFFGLGLILLLIPSCASMATFTAGALGGLGNGLQAGASRPQPQYNPNYVCQNNSGYTTCRPE